MSFETISVIGLGYIGLPTAAMFASCGKKVIGVDVSENVVNTINQGRIHIVEPELDILVSEAVSAGHLKATTKPEPADAFLIAVPTPFQNNDDDCKTPTPDLSYIESACRAMAPVLKKGDLVILESTSPVGATEQVAKWLAEERADLKFPIGLEIEIDVDVNIAHCPERVLPGHVVRELVDNDRVIGGLTKECSERSVQLYRSFVKGDCVVTNARTAEMAKLTENSARDVQIAFANELSVICDELDINVWELISLANRHPRINILQPGPGVGGHCIAVDPWFIVSKSPESSRLIRVAREVNDSKPQWVINKVDEAVNDLRVNYEKYGFENENFKIICYGLAFKANIDDLRESPSLSIARSLTKRYPQKVYCVEPNIDHNQESVEGVDIIPIDEARSGCHIHVFLVEHKEFIPLTELRGVVIDTKGIYNEK